MASSATKRRGLALVVIASAQLMVVLDATIVNIALPHIRTALGFSQTGLSWVLNAYTLVFGGLLLLGGRTGDVFGRRRMFVFGVSLFALASLLGGFAPNSGFLLAMRAVQGVGGAIASPTALALIAVTFDEGPDRNKAFGVYAAVSGAGAAIGLILGGVLTDALSWRWVFFVNAPIGLVLALSAPYLLPEGGRSRVRLDLPGALASTAGMALLVYGFIHAATKGWQNLVTLAAFGLAAVLLVGFVMIESRTSPPLMPLRLFRSRPRVGSYAVMLITGSAVFAMFFFLTQYVQEVRGYSPLKAGFSFLPVSAVIVITAQIASRLVARVGARPLMVAGTLSAAGGLLGLAQLSTGSSYISGVLPFIGLIALGMGLIFVPVTLGAVAGVAPEDSGIASAMLNVGQQVGGTIGLSALVTIFSTGERNYFQGLLHQISAGRLSPRSAALSPHSMFVHGYVHGADLALYTGAALMALGMVCALLLVTVSRDVALDAPSLQVPG